MRLRLSAFHAARSGPQPSGARQPVQHVRQRLRMHQPVFDGYFQHRISCGCPSAGRSKPVRSRGPIPRVSLAVALDLRAFRPIRGVSDGNPPPPVYAKSKQLVERPLNRAQPKRRCANKFQSNASICPRKNNAVSLGMGCRRWLLPEHAEYLIGSRAGVN